VPPEFQDPLKANSISESMLNEKIQALKEIRQLRYDSIEHRLKERLEKSQIREGGLVRLLNINRTDKQSPNYLPNTFKIVKLHNHLVMLEDVDNPVVTHRVHIDRIKPIHQISSSVVNHLRPKQLELLGQNPNLARATSTITDFHSEPESLNNESDSDDDDLNVSNPDLDVKSPDETDKVETTKAKSVFKAKTLSVIPKIKLKDPLRVDPVKTTKTIVADPKVVLIPKVTKAPVIKAAAKPPSVISVSPSDSVSQVAKAKTLIAKAVQGMADMFKQLSPDKIVKSVKKTKTKSKIDTPIKFIKAEPMSPGLDDTARMDWEAGNMITPERNRDKYLSDDSPDRFLTPESSPEIVFETPKVSTKAQGAIPRTGAAFALKPSKFNIPLDQPVFTPPSQKKIKTEDYGKRKALSPSKDELEVQKPKAKVIVRSAAMLSPPEQQRQERPKRNIGRPDYALLEKGIRKNKSPEY
jgi:hypothetical protein